MSLPKSGRYTRHAFVFILLLHAALFSGLHAARSSGDGAEAGTPQATAEPAPTTAYQFVTPEFERAVRDITADDFFESIPILPQYETGPPSMKEYFWRASAHIHYDKAAENLCQPITAAYNEMLSRRITGEDVYTFSDELNRVMKAAGAYTLPILVQDSQIGATYYNPAPDKNDERRYGSQALYEEYLASLTGSRFIGNLDFYEDGSIESKSTFSFSHGGDQGEPYRSYNAFLNFHDYALNRGGLELKNFGFDFFLRQSYVFVFPKADENPFFDKVFLSVSFPYQLYGTDLHGPMTLSPSREIKRCALDKSHKCLDMMKEDKKVSCEVASVSSMFSKLQIMQRFDDGEPASILGNPQILTAPMNPHFLSRKVTYEIMGEDVADPSLACWLSIVAKTGKKDVLSCKNSQYGDELMSFFREDVCFGKNGVIGITPVTGYPYTAPPQGRGFISSFFNDKCRK